MNLYHKNWPFICTPNVPWAARMHRVWQIAAIFMLGCVPAVSTADASTSFVATHYTKREAQIVMRDGAKLFTTIYAPNDRVDEKLPFLMTRSNYMGAFPHDPPEDLAKSGYIFVFQDARGTYRSDGNFLELSPTRTRRPGGGSVDESTDTYDTVAWLLTHVANNNGRVGIHGGSYEGFYAAASITSTHPAIKAADIEFMGDWNYRHGAFMLADSFEFYVDYKPKKGPGAAYLKYPTRDSYELFMAAGPLSKITNTYFKDDPNPTWADLMAHDTLDGYWQQRDLRSHLVDLNCAVLNVGSFLDQYGPAGPIDFYQTIQKSNPKTTNLLVMGPWSHGGNGGTGRKLGNIDFALDTAAGYRKIRDAFFNQFLKNRPATLPKVMAFDTGSKSWHEYQQWPPVAATARTLYLRERSTLSFDQTSTTPEFDEYVSDPAKPVPVMGLVQTGDFPIIPAEYMTADQRFAARRPDVVVYQTEPLRADVTVVGPVTPHLYVSTTGTDSDWAVKLIDVYPPDYPQSDSKNSDTGTAATPVRGPTEERLAGYQLPVRVELLRGKFRNSWENPEAFVPGLVTELTYRMSDVNHTFRKGHRIMVQIQSSMFPVVDLNPQTFLRIPDAREADFHAVTQRVHRGPRTPSAVMVTVLDPSKAGSPANK